MNKTKVIILGGGFGGVYTALRSLGHRRRLAGGTMDSAIQSAAITALAAIAGSVVGGLASFLTTFFTQRNQAHRDLLARDVAHREELYSQFIREAANLYADSLDKTLEEAPLRLSECIR